GQVERLLDALDKSAYRDNTIVVFWGDHGWSLGEKHHWRKFALWEEPTRAPYIWVAPGVTKAGTKSTRTVDFMSIYPTLSELCGMPVPKHVEGVSIKKLLADPNARWTAPALTTHGFQNHAARSSEWRYIRYANGDEELYDETKDPYEWTNVAGDKKNDKVKSELARVFPKVNTPRGVNANGSEATAEEAQPPRRNNRVPPTTRPPQR
ncbi:MAG: sulfatase-like hydrolase/transferase, partial [Blastocatellia bacterium]